MNLIRPYKEALPKKTIRKVLNVLEEIDLLALPINWGNPYHEIYSVRVEAVNDDGKFAANGKGRTQIFALASAYAELVERIQNQLISGAAGFSKVLLNEINHRTGFYYYPDEKPMPRNDFENLPKELLEDICSSKSQQVIDKFTDYIYSRNHIVENGGITSVPFYDIQNDKITYLPYNLLLSLTGSNGMASGNTISEATYQSLCEIYERKAASTIYYDRLTPPTVDEEYLELFEKEYEIIKQIRRKGFGVIVKDFSCNMMMPVVGLILTDKETNKYRLNVGSDTSFQIALSRTLTEIYQGSATYDDIKKYLLDMPNEENSPFLLFKGTKTY
ncbi:MAG: YcaO-like family protein [Prevotellaceae bacterium]|nr:YcaO-like family protein [Prevotellaceae bacterium]